MSGIQLPRKYLDVALSFSTAIFITDKTLYVMLTKVNICKYILNYNEKNPISVLKYKFQKLKTWITYKYIVCMCQRFIYLINKGNSRMVNLVQRIEWGEKIAYI